MIQTAADQALWPLRSMLFVPASMPERVRKTPRFGPDAVAIDLEDSVPPDQKLSARRTIADSIGFLHRAGIAPFVRTNGMAESAAEDLAACVVPGLAGIVLPKVNDPAEITALHELLSRHEERANIRPGSVSIAPIPETAKGLRDAYELAAASPRVAGLMTAVGGPLASGDVARAMGIRPTVGGMEQAYVQSKIVLDSRAAGARYPLAAIIGTPLKDLAMTGDLIRRAKTFGFTGAVLIHPDHVAIANDVFSPTPDEVAYAEGMLAALAEAERKGTGAITYQGTMVDYAMLAFARETVAEARRRPRRTEQT